MPTRLKRVQREGTEVLFMDSSREISRADALKGLIVLPALAAGFGALTLEAEAAKSAKAAVKYQDHPKGAQKCSGCRYFIKGKTATANGTCQIVSGSISPNGWCVAWAKKYATAAAARTSRQAAP
jgi:hypothetical protein